LVVRPQVVDLLAKHARPKILADELHEIKLKRNARIRNFDLYEFNRQSCFAYFILESRRFSC
jgi:hypothetical protein